MMTTLLQQNRPALRWSLPALRRNRLALLACFGLTLASTSLRAQMSDDVRRKLTEMGPLYTSPAVIDLYRPLVAPAPKDVTIKKGVAYGQHPRQVLDIYQPAGRTNLPILVYVHGGGYISGDRDGDVVYGNVTTYFARNGMLAINAEYRLAPEFAWPSGGNDVAGVVAWVKKNAAQYGGDPNRIYLMGHSAGATHVATYVFDKRVQPRGGHGVAAAILVSGRYRVYSEPDDPAFDSVRAYFGADASRYASRSVIERVPNSRIPVMLVTSEYDQQNLVATTGEMFKALCDRDGGQCPRLVQLKHHNHLSEIYHFNSGDEVLGKEILEFLGVTPGASRWATNP